MITALHQVFGRQYAGVAYWAINTNIDNPTSGYFGISTVNGNIEIDWKDGSSKTNYNTTKNTDSTLSINNNTNISLMPPHTFPSNFIQNVEIKCLSGLNDVYSLYFGGKGMVINQDFGSFINQFPNLYSINIDIPHSNAYFNGDISQIPNKVEKIYIRDFRNSGNLYLNISNFNVNSQLKEFKSIDGQYNHNGFTNIYGDLSKLPPLIKIFTLKDNLASTLTYTAGRTWASSFDTLDLGNATMSYTDVDNLLNDMNNSITTAIGGKVIHINGYYTNTTAYNGLIAKGFTITGLTIRQKILDLPLQNNFTDTTGINTMIAGGTSNLPTFTLEGGEYAATFNGSQSLKTNANFNINSDKVSFSFWVKRTSTNLSFISELSSVSDNKNAFYLAFLSGTTTLRVGDRAPDNTRDVSVTTNAWKHIVIVIDRALDANNTMKIYIDGIRQTETVNANNDTSGNYINDILFIGQRGGNSSGFIGQIKFFKIFNYPLSTTEITKLYNKTM